MSRSVVLGAWQTRLVAAALGVCAAGALAQPPAGGPPRSPRESAPIDLTGNWVAIVNEDWRWRMVTPPKGDVTSIQPLNARGREAANAWDPSEEGSCKAFGAAGLMRMPTRLVIEWTADDVLEIRTDAGEQRRVLRFGDAAAASPAAGARTLQGHSVATWRRPAGRGGLFGAGPAPDNGGFLEVETTNLAPGWLRRNGVPYSDQTVLTEYFDRFPAPNGDEWFVVTTIVEDPVYLNGRYVTSSHFRREADASGWNPTPCRADP